MAYRLIDLFCGAGGMSLGFVDPRFHGGFRSVWAVDSDPASVATHKLNFGGDAVNADLEVLLNSDVEIPAADVVIGGPPCQGFSLLNKNRAGDQRRTLWQPFMDVVELSGASAFVIENVPELYRSPELEEISARANDLGFGISTERLLAADYGTPQTRKRCFVVGWKKSLGPPNAFPPKQTHAAPDELFDGPRWKTVRDAIGNLPRPEGTALLNADPPLDLHFGRSPSRKSLSRYRAVPPGGNRFDLQRNAPEITPRCWIRKTSGGTDLFGRLWWDRPSVTIRTEFFKPEKGRYLHPDQHRPITHREAARLMGFPDDFQFAGNKLQIARQIGNAVPPHLAGAVARTVAEILLRCKPARRSA